MRVSLETIKALHEELGVATLLGISNAGYMLPHPRKINLCYFIASVSWGLDVAMIDPFTPYLPWFARTMDFLMGVDPYAQEYLAYYRAQHAQLDNYWR
jgi:5-methyltetrahydrofolate--homocysteine methyltransferase